jgi:uncharacterized protein
MAQSNEELIHAYIDAWMAGDVDAAVDCYGDDVVLHILGTHPLAGVYHGKPAVRGYINKLVEVTGGNVQLVKPYGVLVSDTLAVDMVRSRFKRGDKTLELNRAVVYHLHDGKIREFWVHDDDQEAVDEFFA